MVDCILASINAGPFQKWYVFPKAQSQPSAQANERGSNAKWQIKIVCCWSISLYRGSHETEISGPWSWQMRNDSSPNMNSEQVAEQGWVPSFLLNIKKFISNPVHTRHRDCSFSNQCVPNWFKTPGDQVPQCHIIVALRKPVFVSLPRMWSSTLKRSPVWAGSWILTLSDWKTKLLLQEDRTGILQCSSRLFWAHINRVHTIKWLSLPAGLNSHQYEISLLSKSKSSFLTAYFILY